MSSTHPPVGISGIRTDISPTWTDLGVPQYTERFCHEYDGKRCQVMGFRPDRICDPAVISMYEVLAATQRRAAQSGAPPTAEIKTDATDADDLEEPEQLAALERAIVVAARNAVSIPAPRAAVAAYIELCRAVEAYNAFIAERGIAE